MRRSQAAGARPGSERVRRVWRPNLAQRLAALGGVLGSFLGLVVGLGNPNTSLPGVLLLYLLGFLTGVVVGAAIGVGAPNAQVPRRRLRGRDNNAHEAHRKEIDRLERTTGRSTRGHQ